MHKLQPSLYHIYNQSTHCLDNPDTLPHLSFRLAISISNQITVKNGVKYCLVILNNRLHVLLLQEIKHIKTSIKTEICYLKHPQQRSACAGLSPNSICQSQHFRMYCNLVSKDMFLFRVPVAILLFESQHTLQQKRRSYLKLTVYSMMPQENLCKFHQSLYSVQKTEKIDIPIQ